MYSSESVSWYPFDLIVLSFLVYVVYFSFKEHYVPLCYMKWAVQRKLIVTILIVKLRTVIDSSALNMRMNWICVFNIKSQLYFLREYTASSLGHQYSCHPSVVSWCLECVAQVYWLLSVWKTWLTGCVCVLLPSARDADEREKWIHALEGTILRHTLQLRVC